MSDQVKRWSLITNGVLILVIIFLRSCSHSGINNKPVFAKADTTVHKVKQDTSQLKPQIVYKPQYIKGDVKYLPGQYIKGDTVYLPAKPLTNKDSIEAIQKYFLTSIIMDSIRGFQIEGWIRDSIGKNKLLGRTYALKNSRKTVENIMNPARTKLFAGGIIGTNLKSFVLAPSLLLETKKDQIYGLSYNIPDNTPMISLYWKIHLGK